MYCHTAYHYQYALICLIICYRTKTRLTVINSLSAGTDRILFLITKQGMSCEVRTYV